MVLAYSQTVYDWLKLGHVLAAVIWVGGDVMILILSIRVLREADPQREAAFVHDLGQIGKTIHTILIRERDDLLVAKRRGDHRARHRCPGERDLPVVLGRGEQLMRADGQRQRDGDRARCQS